MKQQLMLLAFTGIIAGALTSCGSSEKKVEEAQQNVAVAEQNLDDAETQYAAEWDKFQAENTQRIQSNETELAAYREREKNDSEFKRKYNQMIDELELKNEQMKAKMREGKEKAKTGWEDFKREWNKDMDELGNSIKNLGKDNKK